MGSPKDDRRKSTRRAKGVTQDAAGQWWAYIYQYGKQHKYRCASEAAAKTKRKELEQAKGNRVSIRGGKATLHTWLDYWLNSIVAPAKKPKTYRFYRQMCEHYISPRIGHIKLEALEPEDIRYMLEDMRAGGFSERTIRHAYTVLKTALNQAARDKKIDWNPITAVDPPDVKAVKGEPLSDSEAAALLGAVRQHRLYVLYVLAIYLGLRKGECLGLRIGDVDLDAATLTVSRQVLDLDGKPRIEDYTKNNKQKVLPLTAWMVALLRTRMVQLYAERERDDWQDTGLLFPSERGTPMSERNLDRHFKAACVKAKIRLRDMKKRKGEKQARQTSDLHFHYLRNTCLSWLGSAGANKSVIQAIAGHADKDVTDGYITIDMDAKRAAIERVEQMRRAA